MSIISAIDRRRTGHGRAVAPALLRRGITRIGRGRRRTAAVIVVIIRGRTHVHPQGHGRQGAGRHVAW